MKTANVIKPLSQGKYILDIFKTYMVWFLFHLQRSWGYEDTMVQTMECFPNIWHQVLSSVHCVVWWQFLHVPGHSLVTHIPVIYCTLLSTPHKLHLINYISIRCKLLLLNLNSILKYTLKQETVLLIKTFRIFK